MKISEFIGQFSNHPVLFIGTGLSMRYLVNSYSWEQLLKKICFDLKGNDEFFYDLKEMYYIDGNYRYDKIATDIEKEFDLELKKDRNGKFKYVNDIFYDNMTKGIVVSRFKIYISDIFSELVYRENSEIVELKKARLT